MNFNSDDLKRLEALISAASPAPVEWGAITGKTIEQHVEDFRSSLSWDTAVGTDLHGVYLSGSETVVCHTGNGPHSEANARLITFAINNFPKIAEHLRAALQQTKPPHEREPPHCPTCDCGAANQS